MAAGGEPLAGEGGFAGARGRGDEDQLAVKALVEALQQARALDEVWAGLGPEELGLDQPQAQQVSPLQVLRSRGRCNYMC